MKIRNGFISNSSSSSFLVKREKRRWVPYPGEESTGRVKEVFDIILSPEQEMALENFGFTKEKDWCYEDHIEYTYEISCNQDCIAKFLVKNKIPFTASVHYGHENWFWDGKHEHIICFINHGAIHSTYGLLNAYEKANGKKIEDSFNDKAGYNIPVKDIESCESEDCSKLCEGNR